MSVMERLTGAADRLTELDVAVPDAGRVLRRSRRRRGSVWGVAVAAFASLLIGGIGGVATSRTDRATADPALRGHFDAPGFLVDVRTGRRSPLPAGLVEGFGLSDAFVVEYVPSPDGKRVVAFSLCKKAPTPCAATDRMAVGNVDGTDVHTITPPDGTWAGSVSWSPDSTRIVYEAQDVSFNYKSAELVVEDLTTGAQTQITHLDGAFAMILSPKFAPDGQSVLFMLPRSEGGPRDVWSVPVTGGEPTLVIPDAAFPAPLPDGKTIAYISQGEIWIARIDDPGSARVLTSSRSFLWNPAIGLAVSPDGTNLVYDPWGPSVGVGGIQVVDVGTGAVEYRLSPGDKRAAWLDNHTLIVTELTRVDD